MTTEVNERIVNSFIFKNRVNINKYEKCGQETIDLVNALNPTLVLDLGCGRNMYKPYIKNLVGIDITDSETVDIVGDITNIPFNNETADVCLCFGSINFGDDALIEKQITEMRRVLKPGGLAIFRGNMNEQESSLYYAWDIAKINRWTTFFNFQMHQEPMLVRRLKRNGEVHYDWPDTQAERLGLAKNRSIERLYWIWKK